MAITYVITGRVCRCDGVRVLEVCDGLMPDCNGVCVCVCVWQSSLTNEERLNVILNNETLISGVN